MYVCMLYIRVLDAINSYRLLLELYIFFFFLFILLFLDSLSSFFFFLFFFYCCCFGPDRLGGGFGGAGCDNVVSGMW